jgi:hypothetical protein
VKSALIRSFLLAGALCVSASAGSMSLEMEQGKNIVLHEDSTWNFEHSRLIDLEEDFTVELGDDRIVLIRTDGSWSFVSKEYLAKQPKALGVQKIEAAGKGSSADVAAAKAEARKRAYAVAARRMRRSVGSIKAGTQTLTDCIARVEKDEFGQETFTTGKGWDAVVEVEMDQQAIQAVLDCCTKE